MMEEGEKVQREREEAKKMEGVAEEGWCGREMEATQEKSILGNAGYCR